jgi:hypothetical protein
MFNKLIKLKTNQIRDITSFKIFKKVRLFMLETSL